MGARQEKELVIPAIGRSIEMQAKYVRDMERRRALGITACILCERAQYYEQRGRGVKIGKQTIALSNPFFTLMPNDYPYSVYDGHQVLAHHMLVPLRHLSNDDILFDREYSDAERDVKIQIRKQTDAYATIMGRTDGSAASSVKNHAHLHYLQLGSIIESQVFSIPEQRNDVTFVKN